ncbi:hypothetical protein BOTBODRAFT_66580 [Botryobasidium botryosum FD-172 SS1]|uniref:FAD-binding domain-containing protein n=1 Tax=Botryobasidium botryosum (strain FD-172 SS1) TaxID=930990 RepID=A0A067MFW4_BOTB1|nr:hypothetical protein BOTBODRAFT_66580 [Botryobasidium botryosum FD-172 SS1]
MLVSNHSADVSNTISPALDSHVDVLIIGAGPAGSFLAFALCRAGVRVRIVDKKEMRISTGHADGIQPRTIEVFQSYGLAKRFLKEAAQVRVKAYYVSGPEGGIVRTILEPTVGGSRYPFLATLAQSGIESLLRDAMGECGVYVEQPKVPMSLSLSADETELQNHSSEAYPVKVMLERPSASVRSKDGHHELASGAAKTAGAALGSADGAMQEVVRARYLVGADGAHSWVRSAVGIDMVGESTNFVWGVVDFVPESDFPDLRLTCAIRAKHGNCMIIPRENDLIRVYVHLDDVEVGDSGRLDRSQFGPDEILRVAQKCFDPYKLSAPQGFDWWTVYIVGQRVASNFSVKNRVFIIGDACHTHSPKAGQGMNASMSDAHNLAWKLVYVMRQWAPPTLLDTYEFERRKFAQDLIDFDKMLATLYSVTPRPGDKNHEQFVEACNTYGTFIRGHGVQYEASTITDITHKSIASGLVIGQRIPPGVIVQVADFRPYELHDLLPSDTRFKILVLPGDTSKPEQKAKLGAVAAEMVQPEGFVKRFTPTGASDDAVFDIITISYSHTPCAAANMLAIPPRLRSHWSKIFIDAETMCEHVGGNLYASYGVSDAGAIIVCRPDGYVGMVAALDDMAAIGKYFANFLHSTCAAGT